MENVESKKRGLLVLGYERVACCKPAWVLSLVAIAACLVAKAFFCSVTIDGGEITNLMTADYWNFGREMLNGKVLYRDIVDHKGTYLFWVYSLMHLLSGGDVRAVVFFECLLYTLTICAFYWYTRVSLAQCKDNKLVALFPTALFAIGYLSLTPNVTLVNTEGVSVLALFLVWGYIKRVEKVTPRAFSFIGVALGVLFNFKMTSIVPYIPIFFYACVKHAKNGGKCSELANAVASGAASFLATGIPFLLYLLGNECLQDCVEVFGLACGGRNDDLVVQMVVVLLTTGFGTVCVWKGSDDYGRKVVCVATLIASLVVGSFCNYYVAFYIAVLFLELFQFERTNALLVVAVAMITYASGAKEFEYNAILRETTNTREIAKKYEITNDNILYLTEDMGYGIYASELFREPYQWVPTGMLYSDEFTDFYLDWLIGRIESKQFEYVFAPPTDWVGELEALQRKGIDNQLTKNQSKVFVTIAPYLEENYRNDLEQNGYLYKAR